jgi:3-oxoacyl-[acyl-carrier protein] reductase
MRRLNGRTALVTAATRGIGLAVAKRFVDEGATVYLLARDAERAQQAVSSIGAAGFVLADLEQPAAVEAAVDEVLAHVGRVDILFHNTGGPRPGRFLDLTVSDWERAVSHILYSAIILTRGVLPGMLANRWGRLIYSTSSGVITPLPLLHLSNVVRSAVAALAGSLAPEVGPYGVTTHVLAPGHIVTERQQEMQRYRAEREGMPLDEYRKREQGAIAVARFGRPEEVAALAAFLASDEAGYLTGQIHAVDGGFSRMVPVYSEIYTREIVGVQQWVTSDSLVTSSDSGA